MSTTVKHCGQLALWLGFLVLSGCVTLTPPSASTPDESSQADADDQTNTAAEIPAAESSTEATTATTPTETSQADPPAPIISPVARLQRVSPFRHVSEFLSSVDWQTLKSDTVGLKICAPNDSAEKTVEVADPSPLALLNEAAIAWARASQWQVVNGEGASFPVCTFVVARFGR